MKDSDLGIPPRPPVIPNGANGPTPQTEEKRGPGAPTKAEREAREAAKTSNVKSLSTELLIETKRNTEILVAAAAGMEPEVIEKVADIQLAVMDLERILITRRKASRT